MNLGWFTALAAAHGLQVMAFEPSTSRVQSLGWLVPSQLSKGWESRMWFNMIMTDYDSNMVCWYSRTLSWCTLILICADMCFIVFLDIRERACLPNASASFITSLSNCESTSIPPERHSTIPKREWLSSSIFSNLNPVNWRISYWLACFGPSGSENPKVHGKDRGAQWMDKGAATTWSIGQWAWTTLRWWRALVGKEAEKTCKLNGMNKFVPVL